MQHEGALYWVPLHDVRHCEVEPSKKISCEVSGLAHRRRLSRHKYRGELMTPFEQVEAAWSICDRIRQYADKEGREIPIQEALEKFILVLPDVDVERTKREAKTNPVTRVYLKSPYGIEYRENTKNWIPFRHGEIKL